MQTKPLHLDVHDQIECAQIVIVMGTTGAGKTTIGSMLADQLNWQFADADTLHLPANIEKMSPGIPLDDAHRAPCLEAIRKAILECIAPRTTLIHPSSALNP